MINSPRISAGYNMIDLIITKEGICQQIQ